MSVSDEFVYSLERQPPPYIVFRIQQSPDCQLILGSAVLREREEAADPTTETFVCRDVGMGERHGVLFDVEHDR